jgi:hypothetical protein
MLASLGDAAESLLASRDNSVMTILLILVLSLALLLCLVCLLVVVHFLRSGRLSRQAIRPFRQPQRGKIQGALSGPPRRWLAIRSDNPQAVQAALGLLRARPCSWEEGVSAAHQRLFISPSIGNWVLVMGSGLPDPAQDVDKCFHFILALSRKLGEVQFFSVNRPVHHHAWVKADHGQILRAYAWAGRTLWNQGRLTRAELDLRLLCLDYVEPAERGFFNQPDPFAANTERVPLLAARWSLDPTSLNARALREAQGIAGELSRSRAR